MAIDTSDHEDTLIGLTDPFSAQASSVKYPDQGAGRTHTFTQRITFPISGDAEGEACFAVNPKVNFVALGASTVGTVVTWAGAWSPLSDVSTNLPNTYGSMYRVLTCGLRVVNTASATNSQGRIVFAKGGRPTLATTTTFNPSNFTSWVTHPVTHGGEWHMVSCPRNQGAYNLKRVADYFTNVSQADDDWETMYVYFSGLPASTATAYIDVVWTVEFSSAEDSPIAQMATPQPVLSVTMQTAVNHVQSAHPPVHKGGTSAVGGFIKREGKKALVKHVIPFLARKATAALV